MAFLSNSDESNMFFFLANQREVYFNYFIIKIKLKLTFIKIDRTTSRFTNY